MKKIKKYCAIFVALALLLCATACDDTTTESSQDISYTSNTESLSKESSADISDESSVETSQETSEESIAPPPEPTAAEIFAEAAAYWAEADNFHHEIKITSERCVGSFSYTEETEREADYVGIGTDTFAATVTARQILEDQVYRSTEIYHSGNAYFLYESDDPDTVYISETTTEGYTERVLPAVILDPSIYENVTFANDKKTEIRFENALDAESWLASDSVWVTEASGIAYLEDGMIERMEYNVFYYRGPVEIAEQYDVKLSESVLTPEDIAPISTANTVSVENIDLPQILHFASHMLFSEPHGSGSQDIELYSELAGVYYVEMINFSSIVCEDGSVWMEVDEDGYMQIPDNTFEWTSTATDKNGVITFTEDGKEVDDIVLDRKQISAWISEALISVTVLKPDMMQNLAVTDLGDFWLLEFDIDPSIAKDMEQYAFSLVLENPTILNKFISDFQLETFSGALSIDKDTGFLTAANYTLEASHISEGEAYRFAFARDLIYEIGDMGAYSDITDETYPDIEPPEEEKATPVFYEINDGDGNKLYLLGTIHVGDDRTAYLPTEIYDAFAASDALAVEMNLNTVYDRLKNDSELYKTYMDSYYYQDGTKLADKVSEELYEDARKRLFAVGYRKYTDVCRPSTVDSFYVDYLFGTCSWFDYDKGVDQRLLDLADQSDKKVYEIEDTADHLLIYNHMSDDTQRMILEQLSEYRRAYDLYDTLYLYELWCEGNIEELRELFSSDTPDYDTLTEEEIAFYEDYNYYMLSRRDEIMFEGIKNYLASGETVFVAVGAAHVLGEHGLVDRLIDAGYTVTLVEYH